MQGQNDTPAATWSSGTLHSVCGAAVGDVGLPLPETEAIAQETEPGGGSARSQALAEPMGGAVRKMGALIGAPTAEIDTGAQPWSDAGRNPASDHLDHDLNRAR